MSHLDLLKTVHCPVTADGRSIKNSFGIVIAVVLGDAIEASAIAELINLGVEPAKRSTDAETERDRKISQHLLAGR